MATNVELSEDGYYVLVTQHGPVIISQIKTARADSLALYDNCDRALVDFRQAEISHLKLIELDNLGIEFKKDVPKCMKIALVKPPDQDDMRYNHLVNMYKIHGVKSELFECFDTAKQWLFKD